MEVLILQGTLVRVAGAHHLHQGGIFTIEYPDVRALLDAPIDDIIILVVVAALFFLGPSKIPELARGIGRAMGELRRGRQEVEREIQRELFSDQARVEKAGSMTLVSKAARELGVPVDGRSETEIKLDIIRAVDRGEPSKVTSAAEALGIETEGLSLTDTKVRVISSIAIR